VVQSMEEMDHDGTGPRVETQPEVAALNADKGPQPTKFHSAVTGCHGHFFGSKPMMEVMQMQGGGMYDFARHICAALLNSAAGLTPVLDETAVRTMWNEYVNRGYVEPTAGVKWSCDDCVEYLQSTMT